MPTPAQIATPYFDKLITEWGRSVILVMPTGKTECPNCVLDIDTRRSSNIYKSGGPNPFLDGEICPVCGGEGLVGTSETATIKLNVQGDPKKWNVSLPKNINLENQPILTWGFLTELPLVLKSRRMRLDLLGNGYVSEYYMEGAPFDGNRIVQGRYWAAFWVTAGGV